MQSIVTKYHPPTNSRGARISATTSTQGKRKYFSYDQDHSHEYNHQHAAKVMFKHMGWIKSTDATIYGIEQPANTYNWQVSYHCSIFTMKD
jgi:transposase-like protein